MYKFLKVVDKIIVAIGYPLFFILLLAITIAAAADTDFSSAPLLFITIPGMLIVANAWFKDGFSN